MQNYFSSLQISLGSYIFVPLCGKSIDMIWLLDQGYKVIGVELSQIACDSFFKENQLPVNVTKINNFFIYESNNIIIYCGDFFKLNKKNLKQIDAVYDRAALSSFSIEDRKTYAEHLINIIDVYTQILLITTTYNQFTLSGPPFSINEDQIKKLFSTRFEIKKLCNVPKIIRNTSVWLQVYLIKDYNRTAC